MYPYNPQVAALARRYNPQYAPVDRQGPPATSGQIQPSGLQPQQPPMNMRPQVAALARQYNPQFNSQMQNMQDQFQNSMQQNQYNLGAQMQQNQQQQPMNLTNFWQQFGGQGQQPDAQNGYASMFNSLMSNPNMDPMQRQAALAQMQQYNPQPAYNPSFTDAGQRQMATLTTPTAQPYPAAQPVAGMPQLPMNGYNGTMTQPNYAGYGGGVGGLARFYTR